MSRRRPAINSTPDSDTHFVKMMEWLALESIAETDRMAERIKNRKTSDAERYGETILDLVISDRQAGIGGRFLLTLKRRNETLAMPWHRLKAGSPVLLSEYPGNSHDSIPAVVSSKNRDSIQVAVDRWPDATRFRVDLTSDEISRRRQLAAITIAKDSRGRLGRLRQVLMGERQPGFQPPLELEYFSELNASQKDAVRLAMSAEDLCIIHGPPGTGKTTTVAEVIMQTTRIGQKVLATAPSNTAVDNLLERLCTAGQNVVRLGHPARVSGKLQSFTLDGIVEQDARMPIIRDMLREAEQLFRQADKHTRNRPQPGEKRGLRQDAKRLRTDARLMEKQIIENIIDSADIICATNTFNDELIGDRWFDLVVIDEACQSTEPGCWVPLIRCDRVVLAGDHQQLPPTVLSKKAAEDGFAISLLERANKIYGEEVTRLLNVQYRMNTQIMNFSSQQFYDEQLIADRSVEFHLLSDLPGVANVKLTQSPIALIDTAGAGWDEELEPGSESKMNREEAKLTLAKVDELVAAGIVPNHIAVIAPYAAQIRLLRTECKHSHVEIDTVDGFQGREKEVVIISFVRSNSIGEIGFLADIRRTNVALTRARRKLIIIADSATLSGNPFYKQLFEYCEKIGGYQTVWEEIHDWN